VPDAAIDVIGPEGTVRARTDGDRVLVDGAGFWSLTGWDPKPEGLCRGDVCRPWLDRASIGEGDDLDLEALCRQGAMPVVIDLDAGVGVVGTAAHQRGDELRSDAVRTVELRDLRGAVRPLIDDRPGKKMMVAFSSWCGCAYDLPGWQAVADELGQHDFAIVGVAVDEAPELVEPFTDGIRFPILLDSDRRFCETYGVVNVPTIIWVDEDGRIARPNIQAFSDDAWVEFHGKPSAPHLDELRRWVLDGELPDVEPAAVRPTTTEDEQLARTEFRLALELRRRDRPDAARIHFERATELAPDDFTIWRAALQLTGDDPFGPAFFERYEEWKERTGGYSYPGDLPSDPPTSHAAR
jgi:peroxiredoxin